MEPCPKIKCFWGFRCAFCVDDSTHKYPLCAKHMPKWDSLHTETKRQTVAHVRLFNNGDSTMNRRKLQIFIHRVEIYDELNKLKYRQ